MEEELHIERHGSSRKSKRFANKRERLQVKNYLKGKSPEDFVDETDDDDYNTDEEKMTFKINEPTAQLMGRYQPWHAGHRALFIKAYDRVGQVAIVVRSQEKSSNNPYSYSEVAERIERDLSKHGYTLEHDFVILQVPNITDITTGRDVGYTITSEKLPDFIEKISATEIRKNENNINNGTSR